MWSDPMTNEYSESSHVDASEHPIRGYGHRRGTRARGRSITNNFIAQPTRGRSRGSNPSAFGRTNHGSRRGSTRGRSGGSSTIVLQPVAQVGDHAQAQSATIPVEPPAENPGLAEDLQLYRDDASALSQRSQFMGHYMMVTPDIKTRNKVASIASQEMRAYNSYKASQRMTVVNEVPANTGGSVTQLEARQRLFQQHNQLTSAYRLAKLQGTNSWKTDVKKLQDEEEEEKKINQRLKAAQNERRQHMRQLELDRKKEHVNAAFLDRVSSGVKPEAENEHDDSNIEDEHADVLLGLQQMFPLHSSTTLRRALDHCHGDVDATMDYLL